MSDLKEHLLKARSEFVSFYQVGTINGSTIVENIDKALFIAESYKAEHNAQNAEATTIKQLEADKKEMESAVRVVFSKWLSEYQEYKDGDFDKLIEGLDKTIIERINKSSCFEARCKELEKEKNFMIGVARYCCDFEMKSLLEDEIDTLTQRAIQGA